MPNRKYAAQHKFLLCQRARFDRRRERGNWCILSHNRLGVSTGQIRAYKFLLCSRMVLHHDEARAQKDEREGVEPDADLLSEIETGKAKLIEKIRAARRK